MKYLLIILLAALSVTCLARDFEQISNEKKTKYSSIAKETLFIPGTVYSSGDKPVCIASPLQYGAAGNGKTDDSEAFRQAIEAAGKTGGTVFVPEGTYYISEPLELPEGVILRGEYENPKSKNQGTLIITDYGEEGLYNTPFISLSSCSGIRNMSFYYLNQSFESPKDLSPCIGFTHHAGATTLEQVMVYNASYPYYYGGDMNAGHVLKRMWATPMIQGFLSDRNGDVTCFTDISMDKAYYENCGFPGSPKTKEDKQKLAASLQKAVAFIFERHDTPYCCGFRSHGIGTGLIVRESSHPQRTVWLNGGGFGGGCSLYDFEFTDCHTGIKIEKIHVGASFAKGKISLTGGSGAAIEGTPKLTTDASFQNIVINGRGESSVINNSKGNMHFTDCTFSRQCTFGARLTGGYTYFTGCSFGDRKIFASGAQAVGLSGSGNPRIDAVNMPEGSIYIYDKPLSHRITGFPDYKFADKRGAAAKYDIYEAAEYGVKADGRDCSAALNRVLTEAGSSGGGIVYVAPGIYRLDNTVYVPEGVELRGPMDSIHSNLMIPKERDVRFEIYGGKGRETGDGAVVLAAHSGIMGLTFYYPEQNIDGYKPGQEWTKYPFTITAKGPGCWCRYTVCANSWQMADFGSAEDCSDYEIIGMRGQPLKTGIFGGNNSGTGRVELCNFSLAEWCYGPLPYHPVFGAGPYDYEGTKTDELWRSYVMDLIGRSDYYKFGYNKNLYVFSNLAYSAMYGIHFTNQNGKYTENATMFYHNTDITSNTVQIDKGGNLNFFVSFQDCELEKDCGARVKSLSTGMNTVFAHCMNVHGGTLELGGLFIFRKYNKFLEIDGGEAHIYGGLLVEPQEMLMNVLGGKGTVEGTVMRNPAGRTGAEGLINSHNAHVAGCMGTNTGLPWE